MAITKNKTEIIETITERELRDSRFYGHWGSYYFGGYWGYDYYDDCDDYDYHKYCYHRDCECECCSEDGYITIEVEDIFGNVRRKCIPAGKEWFRKSQIDIILDEDTPTPITTMHSKMIELGLVA